VLCHQEVEVDASHKTFGVIGVRVVPSVVHVLLSHLDTEVEDLNWVVTRMKAESLTDLPTKSSGSVDCYGVATKLEILEHSDFSTHGKLRESTGNSVQCRGKILTNKIHCVPKKTSPTFLTVT